MDAELKFDTQSFFEVIFYIFKQLLTDDELDNFQSFFLHRFWDGFKLSYTFRIWTAGSFHPMIEAILKDIFVDSEALKSKLKDDLVVTLTY